MTRPLRFLALALLLALAALAAPPARAARLDAQPSSRHFICGVLTGANFNSTADQTISLSGAAKFVVSRVVVTNASTSLTTAQGGVYLAASKTTPFVNFASTTAYTWLTNASLALSYGVADATLARGETTTCATACNVFLSLTTAQGAAASADLYVFCDDLTSPTAKF